MYIQYSNIYDTIKLLSLSPIFPVYWEISQAEVDDPIAPLALLPAPRGTSSSSPWIAFGSPKGTAIFPFSLQFPDTLG